MPWLHQSVLLCPTAPLGFLTVLSHTTEDLSGRESTCLQQAPLSGEEADRPGEKHKLESQLCLCRVTLCKSLNHVSAVFSSVKWGQ